MEIFDTGKAYYEVRFSFDYEKVKAVKEIPGSWYKSATRTWHIPRSRRQDVDELRTKFKVEAIAIAEPIEEINYAAIPELPYLDVPLQLKKEPFPFQERGVAYNRIHKRTIIGDQPGLGKTLQAIATITSFGVLPNNMLALGPGLVICPATLKLNWQKEWMEVTGRRSMILTDSVKTTWPTYYKVGMVDVFITNYESLKKYFVTPGWQKPESGQFKLKDITFNENINVFKWVIIDESHRCKDGTTQQAKFVMGLTKGKEYVYELTGTPVVNKPFDLIPQLIIIDRLRDVVAHLPMIKSGNGRMDYSGYTRFVSRYCSGQERASNLKELNYRLATTCFYRREKSEVMKDLPAKMRQVVLCEISNHKEYEKAQNEFVDYLKTVKGCSDKQIRKKLRGEVMVKMGILKQISARGKMEAVKSWTDDIIDGGEKVILFRHLVEISDQLKQIYPAFVTIAGGDDIYTRQRNINAFQTNPNVPGIICSDQAGGVGVTLTAASRVGFIEFPWTFAACEQCEDRAHRIGQVDSVQCAYFLGVLPGGKDTIDRYCYDLIQKKKNIAQAITGASDDVEEEVIDQLLNLFNQK
jgi:SWI/SNF-related matrix-associated actin-dependent regulator 1 of chromatin subfamily A